MIARVRIKHKGSEDPFVQKISDTFTILSERDRTENAIPQVAHPRAFPAPAFAEFTLEPAELNPPQGTAATLSDLFKGEEILFDDFTAEACPGMCPPGSDVTWNEVALHTKMVAQPPNGGGGIKALVFSCTDGVGDDEATQKGLMLAMKRAVRVFGTLQKQVRGFH